MINEAMHGLATETSAEESWSTIAARDTPAPQQQLRSFGQCISMRVGSENVSDILGASGVDVASAPSVVGLLVALGDLYGMPATVEHLSVPTAAARCDSVRVTLAR
jgi:hypothetical protein